MRRPDDVIGHVPRGHDVDGDEIAAGEWQGSPANRWAFTHVAELVTTARVGRLRRGTTSAVGMDAVTAVMPSLSGRLENSYTDAFLVVRDGTVVLEWYRPGADRSDHHLLMSVSKSLCALVVGTLVDDGAIDVDLTIDRYVPELAGTAYGDATVQQVLDMVVSVRYNEDYRDPTSEVQAQDRVAGWRPRRPGDPADTYEFLTTLQAAGEHGRTFQYCSAGTDVLAWVVENVTGQRYPVALHERLWARLGCEDDAEITVDSGGAAFANGGISCTARDLARVGEVVLAGGVIDGRRIVSSEWIADTRAGGDEAAAAGSTFQRVHPHGSYRNQWWITGNERGNLFAVGIHGQYIWIDPPTRTVTVKFSSCPDPVTEEWNRLHAELFGDVCAALDA